MLALGQSCRIELMPHFFFFLSFLLRSLSPSRVWHYRYNALGPLARRFFAGGGGSGFRSSREKGHTFQRRKTAIDYEFKIAELPFCKDDSGQSLGLFAKLFATRGITSQQILQSAAMRFIGHCRDWIRYGWKKKFPGNVYVIRVRLCAASFLGKFKRTDF